MKSKHISNNSLPILLLKRCNNSRKLPLHYARNGSNRRNLIQLFFLHLQSAFVLSFVQVPPLKEPIQLIQVVVLLELRLQKTNSTINRLQINHKEWKKMRLRMSLQSKGQDCLFNVHNRHVVISSFLIAGQCQSCSRSMLQPVNIAAGQYSYINTTRGSPGFLISNMLFIFAPDFHSLKFMQMGEIVFLVYLVQVYRSTKVASNSYQSTLSDVTYLIRLDERAPQVL